MQPGDVVILHSPRPTQEVAGPVAVSQAGHVGYYWLSTPVYLLSVICSWAGVPNIKQVSITV